MTYAVVEAQSAQQLHENVQPQIDEGWEPLDGVAVATYGAGLWWFYQAILKHQSP